MKRILVGTDFSPSSRLAVDAAAAWARRSGAALRVLHVLPPRRWLAGPWRMDLSTVSAVQRRAATTLEALVETLDPSRDLDISSGIVSGAASVQMARAAVHFGADLLVIGTRGEHDVARGRVTLGGTSTKLVGTTPVPLLLVRTAAAAAPASVLACVDLSPVSNLVLSWARASMTGDGRLSVFHAYEVPFAARLDAYGMAKDSIEVYSQEDEGRQRAQLDALIRSVMNDQDVRRVLVRGDAIDQLFAYINEIEPDLIVLGKHTRRARRRPVSWAGSVSRHMALFAPSNVLIVASQE
jgi:nucleotide-binding universal stress UspA family protein